MRERIRKPDLQGPGLRKRKAGKLGKLFCMVGALCMLFTAAMPAKAAQSDQSGKPYSYKIRIYAGRQGTIGGGEVLEYSSVAYGSGVQFRIGDVQVFDNSK